MNRFLRSKGSYCWIALWCALCGTLPSYAQEVTGVIGSGGTLAVQSELHLSTTLGQAVIGRASQLDEVAGHATDLTVNQGFWYPRSKVQALSNAYTGAMSNPDPMTLSVQPNPSSGATVFSFFVPESGYVTLELYDRLGRHVRTLINGLHSGGSSNVTNEFNELPAGHYTAVLDCNGTRAATTLILID